MENEDGNKITQHQKAVIIGLYRQGNSYQTISLILSIDEWEVKKIVEDYFHKKGGK